MVVSYYLKFENILFRLMGLDEKPILKRTIP